MAEELFPDAIQILDLYHLCENTYSYAKAIFKEDETRYRPWAEKIEIGRNALGVNYGKVTWKTN